LWLIPFLLSAFYTPVRPEKSLISRFQFPLSNTIYAQIGKQMKMSESAVAKDLAKSRKQIELFERWSSEWLTRHEEKFEVVLPAKG
jgi:hypothetical protein